MPEYAKKRVRKTTPLLVNGNSNVHDENMLYLFKVSIDQHVPSTTGSQALRMGRQVTQLKMQPRPIARFIEATMKINNHLIFGDDSLYTVIANEVLLQTAAVTINVARVSASGWTARTSGKVTSHECLPYPI